LLVVAALAAAPAVAQQPAGPRPAAPTPATSAPAVTAVPAGAADKAKASGQQLGRMRAAAKEVVGRAEAARAEKDVVKLNCVNEKLTQVKGLIKVAEQADIALHEALTAKDPAADSEFTKIGIAKSKVDALKGDAEQCIGQLAYIVDEKTTVEVQAPQGLPGQDEDGEARRDGDRHKRPGHHHGPPVHKPRPASRFQ
jgi:hypothetical protein